MKIIKYDPSNISNIPKFFNDEISKNNDQKFIMFIFENIINEVKNIDDLEKSYMGLLEEYDLPFAFFPYNVHFNKTYKEFKPIPHPKIRGVHDSKEFDIVSEPSFGMLILNLEKLKDFKFNEDYKISFYIQDLIHYCKDNNLYISDGFFFDVKESWKLFNSTFDKGWLPDVASFKKEKELFFSTHQQSEKSILDFINRLKERFNNNAQVVNDLSNALKED